jgi:hypothetical protein
MDATRTPRTIIAFLGLAFTGSLVAQAQPILSASRSQSAIRTENFIVSCSDPTFAQEVAKAAEQQRHDLAMHWLGQPLPKWSQACPITVVASPRLGAGGSTTYQLSPGRIDGWIMEVKGSQERILDSVLPHEISHTILATYFTKLGKPVPRWADEGACTTVEHSSERSKHDHFLIQFLSQGRGLPFATMFTLKDYPPDIMPLYAQGYSVTSFLIAQGGPRRFVQFLEEGMTTENWMMATEKHYGYPMIGKLQTAWSKWVSDGGGNVDRHTAVALGLSRNAPVSNTAPSIPTNGSVTLASVRATNQPPTQIVVASGSNPWTKQSRNTPQAFVAQNANPGNVITIGREPPHLEPTVLADSRSSMERQTVAIQQNQSAESWYRQQLERTTQKEQVPSLSRQHSDPTSGQENQAMFPQGPTEQSLGHSDLVQHAAPAEIYSSGTRLIR